MTIGNHTKLQYMEILREGRQILDQIHANDRKIQVITSTIRKDRNEAIYNLEKFDDEIARLQQEYLPERRMLFIPLRRLQKIFFRMKSSILTRKS